MIFTVNITVYSFSEHKSNWVIGAQETVNLIFKSIVEKPKMFFSRRLRQDRKHGVFNESINLEDISFTIHLIFK